ncbi:MAG: HNH endonuclease [Betaproteobacteria bacterium]
MAANLDCEVCRFSFKRAYGSAAVEYCEAHHLVPLSEIEKATATRLEDLAILCANCHRAVHLQNPPHTLHQVRLMPGKASLTKRLTARPTRTRAQAARSA